MRSPESETAGLPRLTSHAYRITVDDGRDSFFALSIEAPDNDDAWLASDTVVSLDSLR